MIVVPCYNEEHRLPADEFLKFLCQSDVQMVFVDDGSHDKTMDRLTSLRAGLEDRVFVFTCPPIRAKPKRSARVCFLRWIRASTISVTGTPTSPRH